jgi:hypothetical protein
MVPVVLTLYVGEEDYKFRVAQKQKKGITALRRQQIARMAQETLDQGALLTAEDFAFRIFNCGLRTISRDLQALSEEGILVPLRSQQQDIGRAITHRIQAVDEIAFLMQISPSLVQAYQELYEQYNTPEYQERIEEIIATVKRRGFRPSQLEDENEPSEGKKGGMGR